MSGSRDPARTHLSSVRIGASISRFRLRGAEAGEEPAGPSPTSSVPVGGAGTSTKRHGRDLPAEEEEEMVKDQPLLPASSVMKTMEKIT